MDETESIAKVSEPPLCGRLSFQDITMDDNSYLGAKTKVVFKK
jgi:hypothetical protein